MRCRQCKTKLEESFYQSGLSRFCDKDCAVDFMLDNPKKAKSITDVIAKKKEKDAKKEFNRRKREFKLNDKSLRVKEAQKAFNAYIRLRDKNEACISCQRHHEGQYHAGHYKTTGASPELRFEPLNCHKQCSACNNHLSGNIAHYRPNLINKIGLAKVEWLEGKHEPKKYTCEELLKIEQKYKKLVKELSK